MLGSSQVQRSNAVGSNPSYLPDADPGRSGGNTYSGTSTEPSIQDYENFFGPSARDIKTDLQRFKRHGRWHLPDILKGPNPWLTDRIDGLITDATNSPFTTKILPYRYKEEVDGKIKWNVWSFDEGMASRVPYESAARTLQQSKRSFAGYMVRQGMAIVLEHNFMMTPKGRENFKNQLNQLIGSIQYTNDLDVHMALVLAPSYQKTMREKYYNSDKSPSQICREFVDLFGMMQKNVNALDILIEEGKAILRTWGGPMPDFLLCNSKLTFQMTMTPEKTSYITQGIDGVKRLRQGPDLGVYRNLSVIHSRSFAMETGQHPRDILRRRVRTAEYYRIPPSKDNIHREFEFYTEERDNWFTLTFHELLRMARYTSDSPDSKNHSAVHRAFNMLSDRMSRKTPVSAFATLDAHPQIGNLTEDDQAFVVSCGDSLDDAIAGRPYHPFAVRYLVIDSDCFWVGRGPSYDMGIKQIFPQTNRIWKAWNSVYDDRVNGFRNNNLRRYSKFMVQSQPISRVTLGNLYHSMKNIVLNDPFSIGNKANPGTWQWFLAYSFYVSMFKCGGLPVEYFQPVTLTRQAGVMGPPNANIVAGLSLNTARADDLPVDITCQFLGIHGRYGSVNDTLFLSLRNTIMGDQWDRSFGATGGFAFRFALTYEVIVPLIRLYKHQGIEVTGIEYIQNNFFSNPDLTTTLIELLRTPSTTSVVRNTVNILAFFQYVFNYLLSPLEVVDPATPGAVYMARAGINTWPMGVTSASHFLHPMSSLAAEHSRCSETYGYLDIPGLIALADHVGSGDIAFLREDCLTDYVPLRDVDDAGLIEFWDCIKRRLFREPLAAVDTNIIQSDVDVLRRMHLTPVENLCLAHTAVFNDFPRIADHGLDSVVIDHGDMFTDKHRSVVPAGSAPAGDLSALNDLEIVIVRPNIEHNMLGVIMGLGGDSLGNTLWGQTELSVYDDSMHGIWGMSYKYHERAIVFNEKNLIRLWDIAYDGYNGGKDDTFVDWMNPNTVNGYQTFKELTLDVSKNYRGPSMMVMAFAHDRSLRDDYGMTLYDKHFRRNWPSPIVFHDSAAGKTQGEPNRETLPVDYDNLQVIDVDEFRVFNNPLYASSYKDYLSMMPHFHEMHVMRKSAGQSSADSETQTDSLAFQGSMRVKQNGMVVQEIHGSGHHGPDYTGVASVRAGKGQKSAGQAPVLHRLI